MLIHADNVVHRSSAAAILKVSYGIEVDNVSNPYVEYGEKLKEAVMLAITPGAFLVDSVPICK